MTALIVSFFVLHSDCRGSLCFMQPGYCVLIYNLQFKGLFPRQGTGQRPQNTILTQGPGTLPAPYAGGIPSSLNPARRV